MKPLFPLLACSALLLTACQTESGKEADVKPVDETEVSSTQVPIVEETSAADTTQAAPVNETTSSESSTVTQSPGLKAYIDPETGELTVPPEEERLRQDTQTSTEEVREEEPPELIPLEGGGYKIPLGDRYQVESTGTVPTEESTIEEK
jgi:predicted small secreted protein